MTSDYMKRKRLQDQIKAAANTVVSKVVGYDRKLQEIWDYYEGEAPLDWEQIDILDPLRLVFQATVGQHGRHGDDKPDREVANYVKQALENKRKYGLYHLTLPDGIAQQADFYINTVESVGGLGNMTPIIDVEVTWVRGTKWADQVKQNLELLEDHFNKRPLIYTSKYYWSFLNDRNGYPPSWTKDYEYWGAGYLFIPYIDTYTVMPHNYLANGFMDWAIWQYWDKGRSSRPRGFQKYPANDLNLVAPRYVEVLNGM